MKSFIKIHTEEVCEKKKTYIKVFPSFDSGGKDLMKKGGQFYAIADSESGMWVTKEQDSYDIIDRELYKFADEHFVKAPHGNYITEQGTPVKIMCVQDSITGSLRSFKDWLNKLDPNFNYRPLDDTLTFLSDEVEIGQYRSKRLSYDITPGTMECYEEIMNTLYEEKYKTMIEWSIGSILAGWEETKKNDRMVLLYGKPGSGKSTVIDIIELLFHGYCAPFEVDEVVSSSRQFAKAAFKDNPLVAIQDDGKMTRIENQEMNKILSHAKIEINEKGKQQYYITSRAICFVATNETVDLSDSRKGMNRRILDVYPSGKKLPSERYFRLKENVEFELGAIAAHCLDVYETLGRDYYRNYVPEKMQDKTNVIKNFMFDKLPELKENDPIGRGTLYRWYKQYCEDEGFKYVMSALQFEEQILSYGYYDHHGRIKCIAGKTTRHPFWGLREDIILGTANIAAGVDDVVDWLDLDYNHSVFDVSCKNFKAQYASSKGTPKKNWDKVDTTLDMLDTSQLHWVQFPENSHHIVLDLDLKNEKGEKDLKLNIEAAKQFPPTYAELSKSGNALHLHYNYTGDIDALANNYDKDIEIKVYKGNSSLRRMLTKCNTTPIADISSGLPLKVLRKDKEMIDKQVIKDEMHLRNKIKKALRREVHANTTPTMNYIKSVLDQAYDSGMHYDVSDLREDVFDFASESHHQKDYCMGLVKTMHFSSNTIAPYVNVLNPDTLVFFDVEVFKNVFIVCWKPQGSKQFVTMINPTATDIEMLSRFNLVGFNNLNYDNPICVARMMGASNAELYDLSKAIIAKQKAPGYSQAKNFSYTDVFDFSSKKQSLKKWEIELKIDHVENQYDWDEPLPEDKWTEVANYCGNDVFATEKVFDHLEDDFRAREILADIADGNVNMTNNNLTTKLIFGDDRNPQSEFNYVDLREEFPDYEFDEAQRKSTFMGEEIGEGGYVYAEPGAYFGVVTFDIASQHPHSIKAMNLFGDRYTKRYVELLDARIAIKHKDFDTLAKLFDGKLMKWINKDDPESLKKLSKSLKIPINSVYGLTAAKFDNPFRDPRNVDNIVAKRGALFMCQLKNKVKAMGGLVIHCKTDSIKVVRPSKEIVDFIMAEGKKYGYTFEIEAKYNKICLVNNAVYIAYEAEEGWTATGAQFAEPYVFKTLFTHEDVDLNDIQQTKSVSGSAKMYLVRDNDEKFIGKVGAFLPVTKYGGDLMRRDGDKQGCVTGTKGHKWLELADVELLGDNIVDWSYYEDNAEKARDAVSKYIDFDYFVNTKDINEIEFGAVDEKPF